MPVKMFLYGFVFLLFGGGVVGILFKGFYPVASRTVKGYLWEDGSGRYVRRLDLCELIYAPPGVRRHPRNFGVMPCADAELIMSRKPNERWFNLPTEMAAIETNYTGVPIESTFRRHHFAKSLKLGDMVPIMVNPSNKAEFDRKISTSDMRHLWGSINPAFVMFCLGLLCSAVVYFVTINF